MLPGKIDWQPKVSTREIEALKRVVKDAGGKPTPLQVDQTRFQQWELVNDILQHPLEDSYQAVVIHDFKWSDWLNPDMAVPQTATRTDMRLKNYPYQQRPVAPEK